MPSQTTNLDLTLPTPDVDTGWGNTLNTDFVKIDDIFDSDGGGTSVGLNIGDTKTAVLRGTLILGDGDGTNTTSAPTIRGPARTGSNVTGSDIRFDASNGTGTGGSGDFVFRTAAPGSSGSTATTLENAFTIKNNGNIGIGAGNPGNALVVNRSTAVETFVKTNNSAGSGYVGTDVDGRFRVWADTNDEISIGTNNIERFRIGSNGELGVSTTVSSVTTVNNGASGQFLQSAGNNAQPVWANPSWNLAGIVPFNGGSNASLANLGSYGAVRITIVNLNPSSVGQELVLRLYDGSSYVTTDYFYSVQSILGSNTYTYAITTLTNGALGGFATQIPANGSLNGTVTITNLNVAQKSFISSSLGYTNSTYNFISNLATGYQNSLTAFSGVRLAFNGGASLSGGYMVVEGLTSS